MKPNGFVGLRCRLTQPTKSLQIHGLVDIIGDACGGRSDRITIDWYILTTI
jgi:hypothetical protein